ncbi:MAG: FliM/FliN family flagellar motor switch protein, partial [Pseudomonadota bacterium]
TVAVLDAPLGSEPDPEWIAAVETAMAEAPVRMDAVLTGLTLPLSELLALEVGQVLPLPDKALTSVVLRGRSGRDAGRRKPSRPPTLTGRLGQFHGQRAVKVADVAGIPLPVGRTTSPPALEGLSTDAVAAAAHPALMAGVADGATAAAMGDDLRGLGAEGDAGLSGLSDDDDLSDLANLPALPDLP